MNQNKQECIKYMDKVKKQLDSLGLSTIMTSNKENILCKVPGDYKNSNTGTALNTSYSIANTCPHAATSNACPYTVCKYPNAACHHHNNGNMSDGSTSNTDNSNNCVLSGTLETYSGSLFRIMPNDIYSGLFLHAIKLHGETCDLKMSFDYSDDAVKELVNVIKFLVE